MLNLISENLLKQVIGTIICCTGLSLGIANAEDITPSAGTPTEDPSLWDQTKETSGDAWDATKEGSAKAWDATKEVSGDAWDATREGSGKAWDATKGAFTDSETTEETPAAGN